ncbi:nose resistant to fluoxetine protein 6-like [Pollicipes pollicipes]|uniref:nose resistant to fluoxetine protein 6-like n=1 Tax=Pollicipes pollicipes TaxID=41117 RepID=UPI0018853A2A|nr:nose resistant to fluoxetine protein 6-like [Pollicipes pollicipes]
MPTLLADDTLCRNHTAIYRSELTSSLWAFAMFDATGKLPDGFLVGNVNVFGNFDECLAIDVHLDPARYPYLPEAGLHFVGRYVPVSVAPVASAATSQQLRLGGGRHCSAEDTRLALQTLLGPNVTVVEHGSKTAEDSVQLQAADVVVVTIMALVGVLMVVGTAVDVHHRRSARRAARQLRMTPLTDSCNPRLPQMLLVDGDKPAPLLQRKPSALGTTQQALVAFSVYTNTEKLMNTTTGAGTLSCLHGIRFLSMTWVVLGHAAGGIATHTQNLLVVVDWFKGPWFQAIANAMPSVDTFYLLSGTLLAYGFCGAYEKNKKFNLPLFYIHRYIRLTVPYAMVIGFTATIFVYLGDGPIWQSSTAPQQSYCIHNWWKNLLYIQNFIDFEETCVLQSWYLATDMQMFVFSPLVLLPLVWRPLLGIIWLCALIVGFLALRVTIWSVKDLNPTFFTLSILLHRLRGRQVTLRWWQWLLGWIVAFAIGISVVYGMTGYQMPWDPQPSKAVAVTYGGLHRFAWGLAVSWVIFACVTGYGGFVNMLLSYPGFIPLSRLTYAGYLIHINVLFVADVSMKGTMYVDVVRLVYRLLGHIITTFAFALPFSLAFEAPFMNLEKMLFRSDKPKSEFSTYPVSAAEHKRNQ